MKYSYKKIPLLDSEKNVLEYVYRPIIPFFLSNNENKVRVELLVDSGADDSLLSSDLAELLGIDLRESDHIKKFAGITGNEIEAYRHSITLLFEGRKYSMDVYFSEELGGHSYGVLGQRDFFSLFRIIFIYSKQLVEIKPDRKL